jgi:4'-phosphopantetheinyl transferase
MKKILKYCFNTTIWQPQRLEWLNLISALPSDERERISRYMFKSDLKQTLIGQILIRYCLKNLINIEWNHLNIDRTSKGRPYLKLKETLNSAKLTNIDSQVDFNVSHAGDFCIIAAGIYSLPPTNVSNSSKKNSNSDDSTTDEFFKIGTDVMRIDVTQMRVNNPNDDDETLFQKELQKHERVINSKFSSLEKGYIYNRPNPVERLTAFYRLWCIKESYVKALGEGVAFDLRRVECVINSELFIDLNSRKYLIANDSQLFIDSKPVKNCKFYEQYYMNSFATNEKSHLHIMTVCVIEKTPEKEKVKDKKNSAQNFANSTLLTTTGEIKTEMDEFVQINLSELMSSLLPLEKVDFEDPFKCEKYEENWIKFTQKAEKPFI